MFHQYLCIIAYYSFNGNLKRSVLHLLLNMLMLLNLLTVDVLTLCRKVVEKRTGCCGVGGL